MNDSQTFEASPTACQPNDAFWMAKAIELARLGQGLVEPNPMVGCIVVNGSETLAQGFHQRYGEAHAEVNALRTLTPDQVAEATVYVTLEPCCHHGKTPPCVDLLIRMKPKRVVIAHLDPFPQVAGKGVAALQLAGIPVDVGVGEREAKQLLAPYLKRQTQGLPWVIAKWAMSLDGRIATRSGESRWISNEASRQVVHRLRGRVDAILTGIGTVLADDPLLTARPTSLRVARRVILDRHFRLPLNSQLIQTLSHGPVWVCGLASHNTDHQQKLVDAGCRLCLIPEKDESQFLECVLRDLASDGCTNLLIEAGTSLFGSFVDQQLLDEFHIFIGRQIIGGASAISPVGGVGWDKLADCLQLDNGKWQDLDGDGYFHGTVAR